MTVRPIGRMDTADYSMFYPLHPNMAPKHRILLRGGENRVHPRDKKRENGRTQLGILSRRRETISDIPGLTKRNLSPDGRIPQREVGDKLVIVMIGLPARGKSYITKKLARYLNWLQHSTEIFNVGERRRAAAGQSSSPYKFDIVHEKDSLNLGSEVFNPSRQRSMSMGTTDQPKRFPNDSGLPHHTRIAKIPKNEDLDFALPQKWSTGLPLSNTGLTPSNQDKAAINKGVLEQMNQNAHASFFDPQNLHAFRLRERVALESLEELLEYILDKDGSVGILDATNSTIERRKAIVDHIRKRAGPKLDILFIESICTDSQLLDANMRLKLSGPDYKGQDPIRALEDFKKRVAFYETTYVPLGDYEEEHDIPYIQVIDVGHKIICHQTHGFLSTQIVQYLLNFNLSSRRIWITQPGESMEDVTGGIVGDSNLSENGKYYARALARFISDQRQRWELGEVQKYPLRPLSSPKKFYVWSSMRQQAVQTIRNFDDEDYDIKQMRMLDDDGYKKGQGKANKEIQQLHPKESACHKKNKLSYQCPRSGGDSYLDIINRLRTVILEVERTANHVLLVSHRRNVKALLAYFRGLKHDEIPGLDVPTGMLYMLEPNPYGVGLKAYRYNPESDWFDYLPGYDLHQVDAQ